MQRTWLWVILAVVVILLIWFMVSPRGTEPTTEAPATEAPATEPATEPAD